MVHACRVSPLLYKPQFISGLQLSCSPSWIELVLPDLRASSWSCFCFCMRVCVRAHVCVYLHIQTLLPSFPSFCVCSSRAGRSRAGVLGRALRVGMGQGCRAQAGSQAAGATGQLPEAELFKSMTKQSPPGGYWPEGWRPASSLHPGGQMAVRRPGRGSGTWLSLQNYGVRKSHCLLFLGDAIGYHLPNLTLALCF